jgi:DNA ligase 1
VLDGEVACIDLASGSINFEMIQQRFQLKKSAAIQQAAMRQPLTFFAFDILRYKGEDLRGRPLMERKAILNEVLTDNIHFNKVISIVGSGVALFEMIKQKHLEGMVAKVKETLSKREANPQ